MVRSTSAQIFNLTSGRVQLRDISVRLPASWSSCVPASVDPSPAATADLLVISTHPLRQDTPWAVQFDGCMRPGKNIELPVNFANKNSSVESRAGVLAKEWVKLKFGVFEEAGFEGDEIYPEVFAEGSANLTNSGCANVTEVRF